MCITEKRDMCVLLTHDEQLAQHAYEERKGPCPEELVERLHAAGIMSRTEYHMHSRMRRIKNVERQVFHFFDSIHFGLHEHSDCTPLERDYMAGRRHEFPPVDTELPPKLWEQLSRLFLSARKRKFEKLTEALVRSHELANLMQYPEFGEWFKVKAISTLGRRNFIKHTANCLFTDLELFESFVSRVDTETVGLIVHCLARRFIYDGFLTANQLLVEIMEASLPESRREQFKRLVALNEKRRSIPDRTRDQRSERKKLSKLLRISIRNLTRDLGYTEETLATIARDITNKWLEAHEQTAAALPRAA